MALGVSREVGTRRKKEGRRGFPQGSSREGEGEGELEGEAPPAAFPWRSLRWTQPTRRPQPLGTRDRWGRGSSNTWTRRLLTTQSTEQGKATWTGHPRQGAPLSNTHQALGAPGGGAPGPEKRGGPETGQGQARDRPGTGDKAGWGRQGVRDTGNETHQTATSTHEQATRTHSCESSALTWEGRGSQSPARRRAGRVVLGSRPSVSATRACRTAPGTPPWTTVGHP